MKVFALVTALALGTLGVFGCASANAQCPNGQCKLPDNPAANVSQGYEFYQSYRPFQALQAYQPPAALAVPVPAVPIPVITPIAPIANPPVTNYNYSVRSRVRTFPLLGGQRYRLDIRSSVR